MLHDCISVILSHDTMHIHMLCLRLCDGAAISLKCQDKRIRNHDPVVEYG